MSLPSENRAELEESGFTNLGALFEPLELEIIAREYDRLVTPEHQVLGNSRDGVYPYRAMMNFRSQALKEIVRDPRLLEIAVELLGPDVRHWWDQGINKSPGAGSYIAWHQDNGYQRGRTQEYCTLWLALDDSTLDNGGLLVVPGSHKHGLLEHEWIGVHAVIAESKFDANAAIPLDARAGDVLLFSSLLVHQTVGNDTDDMQRRAWVLQYCRGDQSNEVTGEIYDDREWVVRDGRFVDAPWSERRLTLS